MKKLLLMFITLCSVFVICSCTTPAPLNAPTNVAVSETGVITWDAVEGADKYNVYVGEHIYISTSNTFTLPDTTNDQVIYVVACGNKVEDSAKSQEVKFVGTSTYEKEELALYMYETLLGKSNDDMTEEEKTEYNNIAGACYNYGIRKENIDEYKITIDLIRETTKENYTLLVNNLSNYSKKDLSKFVFTLMAGACYSNVSVNEASEGEQDAEIDIETSIKNLQANALLNINELSESIGNIVYSLVKSYTSLSTSVIPSVIEIAQSEDPSQSVDQIVTLKNLAVSILKSNIILSSDISTLVKFCYHNIDDVAAIAKVVLNLNDNVNTYIDEIVVSIKESEITDEDIDQACRSIVNTYIMGLDYVKKYDAERIKEALKYENTNQIILYIVLDVLKDAKDVITTNINPELVEMALDIILPKITGQEDVLGALEYLGLDEDDYATVITSFTSLINNNIDLVTIPLDNIDLMCRLLDFTIEDSIVGDMNEEYTEKVITIIGRINSVSTRIQIDKLEPGNEYLNYGIRKNEEGATVISYVYFNCISINEETEEATGYYKSALYICKNGDTIVEFAKLVLEKIDLTNEQNIKDIKAILGVVGKVIKNKQGEEQTTTLVKLITSIADMNTEDLKFVLADVQNILDSLVTYFEDEDVDVNELILAVKDNNLSIILIDLMQDYGTEENINLLKKTVDDVADAYNNIGLFESEEKYNEFKDSLYSLIDGFFGTNTETPEE